MFGITCILTVTDSRNLLLAIPRRCSVAFTITVVVCQFKLIFDFLYSYIFPAILWEKADFWLFAYLVLFCVPSLMFPFLSGFPAPSPTTPTRNQVDKSYLPGCLSEPSLTLKSIFIFCLAALTTTSENKNLFNVREGQDYLAVLLR